jgi:hypothetical protein
MVRKKLTDVSEERVAPFWRLRDLRAGPPLLLRDFGNYFFTSAVYCYLRSSLDDQSFEPVAHGPLLARGLLCATQQSSPVSAVLQICSQMETLVYS